MLLLRVARASLKPDALLVFDWAGHDTAVVRAATDSAWHGLTLTLPQARIAQQGGALLARTDARQLVSTALASRLTFEPEAVLVVQSAGDREGTRGGLLVLWASSSDVPARIVTEPQRASSELARMVEEWLRQQETHDRVALLDQVVNTVTESIVFLPDDGRHAWVNASAAALFSLPAGTVAGDAVAARLQVFGARVVNAPARDALAAMVFGREVDVQASLWEVGPVPHTFFQVSCVRLNHGGRRGRLWTFRDVTAHERAAQVLADRTTLYRSQLDFLQGVLEAMDDAVMVSNTDGALTLLNASARSSLALPGETPASEVSKERLAYKRGSAAAVALPHEAFPLQRALAGEEIAGVALQARRSRGVRDLLVSSRAVRDSSGKIVGAVAVERDVTERNAKEARARQNEKLQALGRMAAGVTHDINNMLTVMQASLSSLGGMMQDPVAMQSEFDTLASVVEESRLLTRSLLDFCRGRVRTTEVVNVAALLERLRPILRTVAATGIQVQFSAQRSAELLVLGDAAEIEQVLFNLCMNASDAMPDGGILHIRLNTVELSTPRVHQVGEVPEGEYVVLEVRDTGMGMSPELLAQIFEPFFTTKAPGTGTGLGLSTVYGIVERYGGHLCVDSAPGDGARFSVYLPRASGAEVEAADAPFLPQGSVDGDGVKVSYRVLVLDDEPMVRKAVARMVTQLGHDVTEIGTAVEAADWLANQPFDVVLSDVRMPKVDGIGFVRLLRERGIAVPVVLMSGYADLEEVDLQALPGITGFLTKPFSGDELVHRLSAAYLAANAPSPAAAGE